jgi:hypothetical protein
LKSYKKSKGLPEKLRAPCEPLCAVKGVDLHRRKRRNLLDQRRLAGHTEAWPEVLGEPPAQFLFRVVVRAVSCTMHLTTQTTHGIEIAEALEDDVAGWNALVIFSDVELPQQEASGPHRPTGMMTLSPSSLVASSHASTASTRAARWPRADVVSISRRCFATAQSPVRAPWPLKACP